MWFVVFGLLRVPGRLITKITRVQITGERRRSTQILSKNEKAENQLKTLLNLGLISA